MNEQEKWETVSLQWKTPSNRPATFTPLVFLINGSIGRECKSFYSRLAQMISEKKDLWQLISHNLIWTKVCSGMLKSNLLCLRGLRAVCRKKTEFEIDVDVSHTVVDVSSTSISNYTLFLHTPRNPLKQSRLVFSIPEQTFV